MLRARTRLRAWQLLAAQLEDTALTAKDRRSAIALALRYSEDRAPTPAVQVAVAVVDRPPAAELIRARLEALAITG